VRDYVSDYNAAIGQVEAAESAAAPALVTELPDGEPEPPARAIGGPVRANAPYIVGERGRELMIPRMDGMVLPNDASERIISALSAPTTAAAPLRSAGGAGGVTLNVTISNPVVDTAARMNAMADVIVQRSLGELSRMIEGELVVGL
jgi:hypothetical protein